jgi:predicted glycogen debranching enzyme
MNLPPIKLNKDSLSDFNSSIQKEWLITNGLGGYASSTVLAINTRKYHGLLVAALHPPGDRTVCLAKLDEEIVAGNKFYMLGANEFHDVFYPEGFRSLEEFSVSPFPQFLYNAGQVGVTKTLFMLHGKNAVVTTYRIENRSDQEVTFRVLPLVTSRHFHLVVDKTKNPINFAQTQTNNNQVQLNFETPKAVIALQSTTGIFYEKPNWIEKLFYRSEALRGESSVDDCYQPGRYEVKVPPKNQQEFSLITVVGNDIQQTSKLLSDIGFSQRDIAERLLEETQRQLAILKPLFSKSSFSGGGWLNWILLAADSFLVKGPNGGKSVIAGYHWFEAWGRDTFVSLPGLMLVTGKFIEARQVLADFNKFCTAGLIPNFLSDLSLLPSCNTVDATMWHVNSVLQYLKYTGDFEFVRKELWDSLKEIAESHIKGTSFGIHMDHDGLLAHGARLTWMDAEVDGDAITPRAGKAVEIQALWYNAMRTMELLASRFNEKNLAETYSELADRARGSFNATFWNSQKRCLFDVLGDSGADASLRPNQLIAASLDFTMLSKEKSGAVVDLIDQELLTPYGLRTLSKDDPRYRGGYFGDRRNRDQAYHNGTVWPWLIGPFTTAYLKAKNSNHQNVEHVYRNFLEPIFKNQVHQACLGTVNEVFDGDQPHTPRGCISQAWSIAEPLRAYVEDILQLRPKYEKELLSSAET